MESSTVRHLSADAWKYVAYYLDETELSKLRCCGNIQLTKAVSTASLGEVVHICRTTALKWPLFDENVRIRHLELRLSRIPYHFDVPNAPELRILPRSLNSLRLGLPNCGMLFTVSDRSLAAARADELEEHFGDNLKSLRIGRISSIGHRESPVWVLPKSLTHFQTEWHVPIASLQDLPPSITSMDVISIVPPITEPLAWPQSLVKLKCRAILNIDLLPPTLTWLECSFINPSSKQAKESEALGFMPNLPSGLTRLGLSVQPLRYVRFDLTSAPLKWLKLLMLFQEEDKINSREMMDMLPPSIEHVETHGDVRRFFRNAIVFDPKFIFTLCKEGLSSKDDEMNSKIAERRLDGNLSLFLPRLQSLALYTSQQKFPNLINMLPSTLHTLWMGFTAVRTEEFANLPKTLTRLAIHTLNPKCAHHLSKLVNLKALETYGGIMSKKAYLKLPASITHLSLCSARFSFIERFNSLKEDTAALRDSLPQKLTTLIVSAPKRERSTLRTHFVEVFGALPTTLTYLRISGGAGAHNAKVCLKKSESSTSRAHDEIFARLKDLVQLHISMPIVIDDFRCIPALPNGITELWLQLGQSCSPEDLGAIPSSVTDLSLWEAPYYTEMGELERRVFPAAELLPKNLSLLATNIEFIPELSLPFQVRKESRGFTMYYP